MEKKRKGEDQISLVRCGFRINLWEGSIDQALATVLLVSFGHLNQEGIHLVVPLLEVDRGQAMPSESDFLLI